jgi:hypothetical protein
MMIYDDLDTRVMVECMPACKSCTLNKFTIGNEVWYTLSCIIPMGVHVHWKL